MVLRYSASEGFTLCSPWFRVEECTFGQQLSLGASDATDEERLLAEVASGLAYLQFRLLPRE
jgi:hypothetical protein